MTRNFLDEPVAEAVVDGLVDLARRSPSAGNAQAMDFLILAGDDVAAYWDVTLPEQRRSSFPWPGLLSAPALIVPWVQPQAYVRRYSEPDKEHTGLGASADAWSTPYWWVDGGMASMVILLAAEAAGLGALFFGLFGHEPALRERFGVPVGHRAVGAIAVGYPAAHQRPSRSAGRARRDLDEVVHRGGW
jgi:nitroreductase